MSSTNRNAVISIVAAVLTIVALCTTIVPIPLTGFLCFPLAAMLGAVAVISGLLSLRQIRNNGQGGRKVALAGVGIGGTAALVALCMATLGIMLLPWIVGLIRGIAR